MPSPELAEALDEIDPKTAAARQIWKMLMTTKTFPYVAEQRAQGIATGRTEGRAEGETDALMLLLEARGIEVSDEIKQRITSCTDLATLRSWITHAARADTAEEIFG